MKTTLETFQQMFPNAWSEKDNPTRAIVNWGDAVLTVYPDDDGQLTLAILSESEWESGEEPGATMPVKSAADALTQVDYLTEKCDSYAHMMAVIFG